VSPDRLPVTAWLANDHPVRRHHRARGQAFCQRRGWLANDRSVRRIQYQWQSFSSAAASVPEDKMNKRFPALALLVFSVLMAQAQNAPAGSPNGPAAENHDAASQPQPHTEIFPETAASAPDPILDPGPLPSKPLSLIGGTVKKADAVRNRVVIQPFGGGKEVSVMFDDRSHIYRNGAAATVLGIHRGDRVYVDTMTLDHKVFARTVRVETATGPVEAHGQVLHFDPASHMVQVRESLTSQTVSFFVTDRTVLHKKNGSATVSDLIPGTLLDAVFTQGRKGGIADAVTILAVPGSGYVFVGRITNVDVARGLLAVENNSDQRSYELRYNPAQVPERDNLRVGAKVTVHAVFDGTSYLADSIAIVELAPDGAQAER
jgi:hypothetical protein